MKLQLDYNTSELNIIRNFFTDSEWDAIDSALSDYQDYGEIESELASSVHTKMYQLFNPKYQDEVRHPDSGAN